VAASLRDGERSPVNGMGEVLSDEGGNAARSEKPLDGVKEPCTWPTGWNKPVKPNWGVNRREVEKACGRNKAWDLGISRALWTQSAMPRKRAETPNR